ncbi:MAG: efflux RND transporter periplasmic adaptor subunit [Alphaproteobacteria bacterium]|nr:efflux RND transporter periplasmic adaptor subunit [Alphaproteobacteria bacterium]
MTAMAGAIGWARTQAARMPRLIWIVGGLALAILVIWMLFFRGGGDETPYRTATVDRGRITQSVSATGSLQPLVSVNVGTTVSGLVEEVLVDFNSQVRAGQILARLEPDTFEQRMEQLQASLSQARADFQVADSDYQRYARLAEEGFASEQLMAQQRASRARASASVQQASAQLETARVDFERSIIRSPIDGVVVDRQVNPGQSVAASFQAPILFVIAQDLSRLQANITVDEADIGQVRETMPVRFTVDAFPDEDFEGRVSQVRQQGVDTNGVVSYTVVVEAENPGRRLLPGMTANASIIVQETQDVARIPNSALRFQPVDEALRERARAMMSPGERRGRAGEAVAQERGPGERGQRAGGQRGGALAFAEGLDLTAEQQELAQSAARSARQSGGDGDRRAQMRRVRQAVMAALEPTLTDAQRARLAELRGASGGPRETPTRTAVIFVLRNNRPEPVRVELGAADDAYTELRGGDLRDGDQIITGGGPVDRSNQQMRGGPMGGGVRIRGG